MPSFIEMDAAVCLALLLLGSSVHLGVMGFSTGSPPSLCDPMRLWHNSTSAQTTAAPYTVTAYPATYKPGDQITVSLRGSPDSFQGFLLQAQEVGGNDSVGSFTVTDSATSRLIACGGMMNSTVTQASDSMKTLVVVTWTAPTSGSLGDIEFRATFVKVLGVFWEDVKSSPVREEATLAPSTIFGTLTAPITRDSCGRTKSCFELPSGCDPASDGDCLFASATADPAGRGGVFIELQGNSSGYIAIIGLPGNLSMGDAFVCAQPENATFWFVHAAFDGSSLQEKAEAGVDTIKGSVEDDLIKCSFIVRDLLEHKSGVVSLAVGMFANGTLGDPDVQLTTNVTVDLLQFAFHELTSVPVSSTSSAFFSTTPPSTAVHSTTIGNFTGSITSDGCQQTKTCLAVPKGCDPANMGNCLFVSTAYLPDQADDIFFELQGLSGGYIAAILSADNQTGTAFVCTREENSTFGFLCASYNGSVLTEKSQNNIASVKGAVDEDVIQCTFIVKSLGTRRRRAVNRDFFILLAVGDHRGGEVSCVLLWSGR
nr:PREDICTED: putative ferric-chelate reductase 1 [Lepisosteus oculatus]